MLSRCCTAPRCPTNLKQLMQFWEHLLTYSIFTLLLSQIVSFRIIIIHFNYHYSLASLVGQSHIAGFKVNFGLNTFLHFLITVGWLCMFPSVVLPCPLSLKLSVVGNWTQTLSQGQSWLYFIQWQRYPPPDPPANNMALQFTRRRNQVQIHGFFYFVQNM